MLTVAPGTVKSRTFRARQALCAAMAEDENASIGRGGDGATSPGECGDEL